MIRLSIGITNLTPGWTSLFQQMGILAEEINFSKSLASSYSALIINSDLDHSNIQKIHSFLTQSSGGLLLTKNYTTLFSSDRTSSQTKTELPKNYSSRIKSFYLSSGLIYCLKFDPDKEFSNNKYGRKRFPFKTDIHPDEIVSDVDRDSLRLSLEILFKELHYHRHLPFLSKWHSPTVKPFFAFRVDTDFGDKPSIQNLYALAGKHNIPMTWFLHVRAHEEWLSYFHAMKNQEIALHGYEHGTSKSYEHVINNIERGKQLMIDAGIEPKGFCVPYSIWNNTLAEILPKFNFKYSSEFTLGYDTLPFNPIHEHNQHPTLQIPIHPICTGSLGRKNASVDEMKEYFTITLEQNIAQLKNVIFYHHPLQPGLEIWDIIFKKVNDAGFTKLTFSEIADFWQKRQNAHIEAFFDMDSSTLQCESNTPDLFLNISTKPSEFHILEASKANSPLNSFDSIKTPPIKYLSSNTIKELNGNKFKLLKTSIMDWKNRIKL